MSIAVINIGQSHDGGIEGHPIPGDALTVRNGSIDWIGETSAVSVSDVDQVIDARGATVIPGLIDSHSHTTFGDYTPRQNTIGFLESYVHGGTTSVISASEVHVPGRPVSIAGVKALAIAAAQSYREYRPGGMRVHAGSVILEPGLTVEDFQEVRENGVWLAKAGFGAFAAPKDYAEVVRNAQEAGIIVMCHTGGGSIPGSMSKIDAEALLTIRPNVAGHVNGGPTALTWEENSIMVEQAPDIALQLVHAGNLKSAIDISEKALAADQFHRVLIATDTPTGTGVIPLGMLRQMAEMVSLGPLTPQQSISAATGSVADVYKIERSGKLQVGYDADFVIIDAPLGSSEDDAFSALAKGDLPAVAVVVTDGVIRLTRSRNTPGPMRQVELVKGTSS